MILVYILLGVFGGMAISYKLWEKDLQEKALDRVDKKILTKCRLLQEENKALKKKLGSMKEMT